MASRPIEVIEDMEVIARDYVITDAEKPSLFIALGLYSIAEQLARVATALNDLAGSPAAGPALADAVQSLAGAVEGLRPDN